MKVKDKQCILEFLRSRPLAVISTVDEATGQPEAALIAFAERTNLELIFQTFTNTRKYRNLQHNNRVALVIGWNDDYITLQYEGWASQVAETKIAAYKKEFLAKGTPSTEAFLDNPKSRLFKIQPTWIAYNDYGCLHPETIELKFKVGEAL